MRTPRPARLLRCLLLGLATTIGVAWSVAIFAPPLPAAADPQVRLDFEHPASEYWAWYVVRRHQIAHRVYVFRQGRLRYAPAGSDDFQQHGPLAPLEILPYWCAIPPYGIHVEVHGFGWPLPCLAGTANILGPDTTFAIMKLSLAPSGSIRVPLRPIWPGLAADTALSSAAWWLVLLAAAALRARSRRRRGRCPQCGYDLVGNLAAGCPECGWGRA